MRGIRPTATGRRPTPVAGPVTVQTVSSPGVVSESLLVASREISIDRIHQRIAASRHNSLWQRCPSHNPCETIPGNKPRLVLGYATHHESTIQLEGFSAAIDVDQGDDRSDDVSTDGCAHVVRSLISTRRQIDWQAHVGLV